MELFVIYSLLAVCCIQYTCAYIEIVDEYGCHDNEFRLTCRHFDTHIAVLEGNFYPDDPAGNGTCASQNFTGFPNNTNDTIQQRFDPIFTNNEEFFVHNIRLSLNRRCSGVNHCSFNLLYDTPGAEHWGSGLVAFKYACVAARHVTRFCNKEIALNSTLQEGFVQSPGYPRFYVGDTKCKWKIKSSPGQRVQITIMDVSLRTMSSNETQCTDELSIYEDDRITFTSCREHPEPFVFISLGQEVSVELNIRSKFVFPKRGVLFYYKGVGCPNVSTPRDSYVSWKNESIAEYFCCVGFVFPDTRRRTRVLHCLDGNTWDKSLPDCINSTELFFNKSLVEYQVKSTPKMYSDDDTLYAVVIPGFLITGLFLVNAAVVYVIYKYRQRKLANLPDEELAVISQNSPTA